MEGLLWGFALLAGVLLVLRATGNFHFGSLGVTPAKIPAFAVLWGVLFIMVGLAESFAFSGYALSMLMRGLGFWPAAALLAFLFGGLLTMTPAHDPIGMESEPPQNDSRQSASDNSALVLPSCSKVNLDGEWIGREVKFVLPKQAKVKKITDIDYEQYFVRVSKDAKPLELWWGPFVSSPFTTQKLLNASVKSQKRMIQDPAKNERGSDSHGETSQAKYWRVFDVVGAALAKYEGVSEDTQRSYDAIINSACFEKP